MNATTNLDVLLLRVFSSIYMNRSVSAAARELDMSQPGVSTALMRLRGQLQDPLFTRTTSGMEPTRRAREMIGPIRRILQTVDQELLAPRRELHRRRPRPRKRPLDPRSFPSAITSRDNSLRAQSGPMKSPAGAGMPRPALSLKAMYRDRAFSQCNEEGGHGKARRQDRGGDGWCIRDR